tara:strand:+ start:867 stop:1553 length:687 start_codon:yes stop_codon:yes gene_type:complete
MCADAVAAHIRNMTNTKRQPRGIPAGGQFAEHDRLDSDAELAMSDLSFDGPLDSYRLQGMSYTVEHFYSPIQRDQFDLDPVYQRGSVWDETRQQNLIRSLLLGIPVGAISLNRSNDIDARHIFTVIDGKQRIQALRAFSDDELVIPASWIDPEYVELTEHVDGWPIPGVRWSGLNLKMQRKFSHISMPSVECVDKDVQQQAEIFRLINTGGVDQDELSLSRAAAVEKQ